MPTNLIILIILLCVAAAAIVGTLIFVRAVDRRLEREQPTEATGGQSTDERRGERAGRDSGEDRDEDAGGHPRGRET
jgi:hypothetical protein